MLKVYLSGFKRPISVIGEKLYEDEQNFVIHNEGIKRFLRQDRIVYVEDLGRGEVEDVSPAKQKKQSDDALTELLQQAIKRKAEKRKMSGEAKMPEMAQEEYSAEEPSQDLPTPPSIPQGPGFQGIDWGKLQRTTQVEPVEEVSYDRNDLVDVNVFFSGAKEQTLNIKVPRGTLDGEKYNPSLAQEIFSNSQVRSEMGDFIISGTPKVEGTNIHFETRDLNEIKEKVETAGNMLQSVMNAENMSAQAGQKPSLALDQNFKLNGSPFSTSAQFSA